MKGKELMVRKRGHMGPVTQAITITRGSPGGLPGRSPLGKEHTLMRLKFMALSSKIGSDFGVKLKN